MSSKPTNVPQNPARRAQLSLSNSAVRQPIKKGTSQAGNMENKCGGKQPMADGKKLPHQAVEKVQQQDTSQESATKKQPAKLVETTTKKDEKKIEIVKIENGIKNGDYKTDEKVIPREELASKLTSSNLEVSVETEKCLETSNVTKDTDKVATSTSNSDVPQTVLTPTSKELSAGIPKNILKENATIILGQQADNNEHLNADIISNDTPTKVTISQEAQDIIPASKSSPVTKQNPITSDYEPYKSIDLIKGRRSIRTLGELQSNFKFKESYRRINTELDVTSDSNTSLNVTVGSEVPNNSSFSFFGLRGRKRERTPPSSKACDAQLDLVSPSKRSRKDEFFSAVASPITMLRSRFSRTSIQSSTPMKSNVNAATMVQNVSGICDEYEYEEEGNKAENLIVENATLIENLTSNIDMDKAKVEKPKEEAQDINKNEKINQDTLNKSPLQIKQKRCTLM